MRGKRRSAATRLGSPRLDSALLTCLADPFLDGATGAKWPSSMAADTATARIFKVVTISTSGSGALNFTFIPDPYVSLWSRTGTFSGINAFSASSNWGHAGANTLLTGLNTVASAYRVVGCGLRIRNLQAPLSATGKFILCPIPMPGRLPNPQVVNSVALGSDQIAASTFCQGDATAMNTANYALVSRSNAYTVSDLLSGVEVKAICRPDNAGALVWKPLHPLNGTAINLDDAEINAGSAAGMDVVTLGSPDVVTQQVDPFWGDFRSMTAFNFQGTGFPTTGAVLEMDIIYHVEYCNKLAGDDFAQTVIPRPIPGTPMLYIDEFEDSPETWMDTVGRVTATAGRFVSGAARFMRAASSAYGAIAHGGYPSSLPIGGAGGPYGYLGEL